MEKFQLTAFLKISGIGAASGIVLHNNSLYIISDNSGFLYEYQLQNNHLSKQSLIEKTSQNILKKLKPDFESIALKGNELHIFGSGSTVNRNKKIIFNLENNTVQENDLSALYQEIKKIGYISDNDLNIEGAFYDNGNLYLLQRGNGTNSKNGIFKINFNDKNQFQAGDFEVEFKTVRLPKIEHIEATFTDAILIENKIYFLACAEDTVSTYDDGDVLGSLIGCMDIETFKIDFTQQISNTHKFEGLTLYQKTESEIIFLLCEDNDTEDLESTIYKLTLTK